MLLHMLCLLLKFVLGALQALRAVPAQSSIRSLEHVLDVKLLKFVLFYLESIDTSFNSFFLNTVVQIILSIVPSFFDIIYILNHCKNFIELIKNFVLDLSKVFFGLIILLHHLINIHLLVSVIQKS